MYPYLVRSPSIRWIVLPSPTVLHAQEARDALETRELFITLDPIFTHL